MKTLTALTVFVISLSLAGCATTQSGGGTTGGSAPAVSSGGKSGDMLTQEDFERMGIKETEDLRR